MIAGFHPRVRSLCSGVHEQTLSVRYLPDLLVDIIRIMRN